MSSRPMFSNSDIVAATSGKDISNRYKLCPAFLITFDHYHQPDYHGQTHKLQL